MDKDIILNLALVISFLTISGLLSRNYNINASIKSKVYSGIAAGILGSLLMIFAIPYNDIILLDFRNFAVIIGAMYGGLVSSLAAATVIAINRVVFFDFNEAAIAGVVLIYIMAFVSGYIVKQKLSTFWKFNCMNIVNVLLYITTIFFITEDIKVAQDFMFKYAIYAFLGGIIVFFIADYIDRANKSYRLYKESAQVDFLTGLNNVRQFHKVLSEYVDNPKRADERMSLLLLDIDYFKTVNDTYGHLAGDIILKEFAKVLKNNTRPFDYVARVGGEEFAIILPECAKEQAIIVAERIRQAVEIHEFPISDLQNESVKINITVSIGVASYPDPIDDKNDLFKKADACLYNVKSAGRNRVTSC
ncbi:diguanylate cyclase [Desulfuribacillus alkaliarsenatis]|uniref:GGDEF domain-containing protein n=1 Tax=Desulfuribacillus alkaliarsenatis TaxID=766136 RepID=A0A1E5G4Q5_9FIRM|nr:diguanylate cyclase [Desulfuribacillus alkaliarsenatis]OEF98157.1 hypothetical protein BHF68_00245 [Desulfuribacillus alkaliarsenatis]